MPPQPSRPVATRTTAPYAFWGLSEEMKKAMPLHDGETVELSSHLRCATGWLARRPCFLRVTNRRLVFVVHYAFQPDRLIAIPSEALLEVSLLEAWIRLRYRTARGDDSIAIRTSRTPIVSLPEGNDLDEDDREVDLDTGTLADLLDGWLNTRRAQ